MSMIPWILNFIKGHNCLAAHLPTYPLHMITPLMQSYQIWHYRSIMGMGKFQGFNTPNYMCSTRRGTLSVFTMHAQTSWVTKFGTCPSWGRDLFGSSAPTNRGWPWVPLHTTAKDGPTRSILTCMLSYHHMKLQTTSVRETWTRHSVSALWSRRLH